jgi:hypothetical protein
MGPGPFRHQVSAQVSAPPVGRQGNRTRRARLAGLLLDGSRRRVFGRDGLTRRPSPAATRSDPARPLGVAPSDSPGGTLSYRRLRTAPMHERGFQRLRPGPIQCLATTP